MTLTAPGKIFLAGEYSVLHGGAALILCTSPRFELRVRPGRGGCQGIPPGAPAVKLLSAHQTSAFSHRSKVDLQFVDPYHGRGGFGASGAQFLLCLAWLKGLCNLEGEGALPLSYQELLAVLDSYHNFSWDGVGLPPSGADLIAQSLGGICYWNRRQQVVESLAWEFQDLDFLAIATGNKIATHEHLRELGQFNTKVNTEEMESVVSRLEKSLRTSQSDEFLSAFRDWSEILKKNNWVHIKTQVLLDELKRDPRILAAKGCGALGADVLLLLVHPKDKVPLAEELEKKLKFMVVTREALSGGLECKRQ